MASPDTRAAQPTAEQLQMAWRHMQHRNGCPATLEAALASPSWHVPLVCLARQLGRRLGAQQGLGAAAQAAARLGPGTYVPPDPLGPARAATARMGNHMERHHSRLGVPMHKPRPTGRDGKRAAANDFDD